MAMSRVIRGDECAENNCAVCLHDVVAELLLVLSIQLHPEEQVVIMSSNDCSEPWKVP